MTDTNKLVQDSDLFKATSYGQKIGFTTAAVLTYCMSLYTTGAEYRPFLKELDRIVSELYSLAEKAKKASSAANSL